MSENTKPKAAAEPKKRRMTRTEKRLLERRRRLRAIALSMIAAVVVLLGLCGWQFAEYADFQKMREAVEVEVFHEGTFVEGIDVSGLTLSQARARWAEEIEPAYSGREARLSDGTSVTAEALGYESNYWNVLESAWKLGREGGLEDRYADVSSLRTQPLDYAVTRTLTSDALVDAFVSDTAAKIDAPVRDAGISGFDKKEYTFTFDQGTVGRELDQAKLRADLLSALENGGGEVELSISETQPDVHMDALEEEYGMIAYAVTDASDSKKSRLTNISLALEAINGHRIEPGEVFSFNAVVGERTPERGYKEAPAFSSGLTILEYGGGICQVSTTLFNAAIKSGMELVERNQHSMFVTYVGRGKDAAVDWGRHDLRFRNTSDEPVYIAAMLDKDENVRIALFGKYLKDGMRIEVETITVSSTGFQTEYVANNSLAPGARREKLSGRRGYAVDTYRSLYDANGKRIKREFMFKSRYPVRNAIVEYGPS